jgi:RNA polymerase sigma factor (sigma-70 family)
MTIVENIQSFGLPELDFRATDFEKKGFGEPNEMLSLYLSAIRGIPLLPQEETNCLFDRVYKYRTSGLHLCNYKKIEDYLIAKKKLWVSNLRLVPKIAERRLDSGIDELDLIQSGNIGLVLAIDHFDPNEGNKFSTYAHKWIKREIFNFIDEQRGIRIPNGVRQEIRNMLNSYYQLTAGSKGFPSEQKLTESLSITPEKVRQLTGWLMTNAYNLLEVEKNEGEDDYGDTSGPYVEEYCADTANTEEQVSSKSTIDYVLSFLPKLQREIMEMSMGINGYDFCHSQVDIANELGTNVGRVNYYMCRAREILKEKINLGDCFAV